MKRIRYTLLIAATMAMISSYSQTANKDEMIKKIFEVLKNKDEEGYLKLFPDVATINSLITKVSKADTTGESLDMTKLYLDEMSDSGMKADFRRDFKKYVRKGEEKGIEWSRARLMSYTSDSTLNSQSDIETPELKGKIYFNIDNKEYYLVFKDVIWFKDKGWYGVEISTVDEKSKENQFERNVLDDDDIAAAIRADSTKLADSTARAGAKKSLLVSRPAKKNKPVKSKSQAPARKPG